MITKGESIRICPHLIALQYKDVVPWGRNYHEYVRMFALGKTELRSKILGCGDGPASFTWECNRSGGNVISVDPLYQFTGEEIRARIHETYTEVLEQTRNNQEQFKWDEIPSVEAWGHRRMAAMSVFLDAYPMGKQAGRYVPGVLPQLPFAAETSDLAWI